MKNKASIIIWVLVAGVVLAAAYTYYSKNKSSGILPQTQQSEATNQTAQGKVIAPDFNLKDLSGRNVKLSDYRGKIVILNFWAVWCKYCKLEMPDLNELNKELEKENEAVIIAVDSEEPDKTVKAYLSENDIKLNVLLDSDGSVTQTYGISGFPTTFIINKDGTIYTYISGATDKATLLEILDKIKNGEPVQ